MMIFPPKGSIIPNYKVDFFVRQPFEVALEDSRVREHLISIDANLGSRKTFDSPVFYSVLRRPWIELFHTLVYFEFGCNRTKVRAGQLGNIKKPNTDLIANIGIVISGISLLSLLIPTGTIAYITARVFRLANKFWRKCGG